MSRRAPKHLHLEDLHKLEVIQLAQLLRISPSQTILDQLYLIGSLPEELRMPANIVPLLAAKFTCQKKKQATLCYDHCTLNPYIIRRIYDQVIAECTIHVERLFNKPAVPAEVTAFILRMQRLHSIWTPPDIYRVYFDVMPEDRRYPYVQSECEACILSCIGGESEILCDLEASIRGRRKRGKELGRLLPLVEAWIDLQERSEVLLEESRKLGRIILECRKRWQSERRGVEPRKRKGKKRLRFSGKEAVVQPPYQSAPIILVPAAMAVDDTFPLGEARYVAGKYLDQVECFPDLSPLSPILKLEEANRQPAHQGMSQASQEYDHILIGHEVSHRYDRVHSIINAYGYGLSSAELKPAATPARTLQPDIYAQPARPPTETPQAPVLKYDPRTHHHADPPVPVNSHLNLLNRSKAYPALERHRLSDSRTPMPEGFRHPSEHPVADLFMHAAWRGEHRGAEERLECSTKMETQDVSSDREVVSYEEGEDEWTGRANSEEGEGPSYRVMVEDNIDSVDGEDVVVPPRGRPQMRSERRLTRWSGLQAEWRY